MNRAHRVGVSALVVALMLATTATSAQSEAMRTVDGKRVTIADLAGQVVLLAFGGVLDPQSPDELPVLQRISDRYVARGVQVYWVSLDSDKPGASGAVTDSELAAFAIRNGFRGPVLRDPSSDVFRTIGVTGRRAQVPTFVVLDKTGAVAAPPIGGFDRESDAVNRIAAVLDKLAPR
jgi:peroxiredoxin